jgi:hypothetical protein
MKAGMRAPLKVSLTVATALASVACVSPAFAATKPRHIVDSRYKISFYTPAGWGNASLTTSTAGDTKIALFNPKVAGAVAIIQVEVVAGRKIAASELAAGIRASGATITGSHLASFSTIHNAEQVTFSVVSSGVNVDGKVDGFFMNGRTYYVAVDSNSTAVLTSTLTKVMNTWGS